MRDDSVLGYAPVHGQLTPVKGFAGSQLIYDVTYTIDADGLRIAAGFDENPHDNRCMLFFGCSFTFGEGVDDHEAMPYVAGTLANLRAYNFGFPGYGPHQMLAAVEHGMVERIVDCRPRWIIYQALPTHVARAAGQTSWDRHGPRYALEDGEAKYTGHFDDGRSKVGLIYTKIAAQIAKSFFIRSLLVWRRIESQSLTSSSYWKSSRLPLG